ncbi:MAG: FprA family A-type flavoprotein [Lachnospiraceae bacterium]|nr:FprA family A-type flavoprotein [Lachnospiraceae bacterium]
MVNVKEIVDGIFYVGASDRRLGRFENMFPVPDGMSYNNYVIKDEKSVLFDTADNAVCEQFVENVKACAGDKLDYLVVLHMEPDHASTLLSILKEYPSVTVVGNVQTFKFMEQFFPETATINKMVVKEGDSLNTGAHNFKFIAAPMVHWPEVLFAYDEKTGALFSADAFGTFGAIDGSVFADDYDFDGKELAEYRRYYSNIVGKYGCQVQAVLKKAAGLDVKYILPLHGPVWRKDIKKLIDKYDLWSRYEAEDDGAVVIYSSMYGHTQSAATLVAAKLSEASGKNVEVYDASGVDVSYLIAEVFRCKKVVIFSPTYNMGIYPAIESFISHMEALTVQNKIFALGQNGTWAPSSGKLMACRLKELGNCTVLDNVLTIKSALHPGDEEMVDEFVKQIL